MIIRNIVQTSVAAAAGLFLVGHAVAGEIAGAPAPYGNGTVQAYGVIGDGGVPAEIGIAFSASALDGQPPERNPQDRCFDVDGNGTIDSQTECEGDYELRLPFPAELTGRADIPFTFAMVNWNPGGHAPEFWSVPHYDIHFYQIDGLQVDAIRLGNCGIFMHCDDFQRAVKPVPAKYINADHIDVQAAVGGMGNHLIDSKTPELGTPPKPFTHTWIFGAFDGEVIFHEVMATQTFLTLGSDTCAEIKQPEAWAKSGYYPTRYCFRREADGGLKVFMEGFVMRDAS